MNKPLIAHCWLFFLIVGCTSVIPSQTASPSPSPKELVDTETLESSPTATLEPDFYTPFGETGSIWVYPNLHEDFYLLLDLESQQLNKIDGPEADYCNVPRNESAIVFCEDLEGELFVYDLRASERLATIRDNSIGSWATNNGQFLYYEYFDESTSLYNVSSYSLATGKSTVLFQQSEQEYELRRWTVWQFSEDGERILVLKRGEGVANITEITGDDINFEIIEQANQISVTLFVWSPSGNSLIYAVQPEIPGLHPSFPDTYYYVDLETRETRLLTKATDFAYWFFPPMYSPDESKIALLSLSDKICIIQVETGSQICRNSLPENYHSSTLEWSPSGKSIIFVGKNKNSPYDENLYIYSIEEDRTVLLLEGIENYLNARSTIWIP